MENETEIKTQHTIPVSSTLGNSGKELNKNFGITLLKYSAVHIVMAIISLLLVLNVKPIVKSNFRTKYERLVNEKGYDWDIESFLTDSKLDFNYNFFGICWSFMLFICLVLIYQDYRLLKLKRSNTKFKQALNSILSFRFLSYVLYCSTMIMFMLLIKNIFFIPAEYETEFEGFFFVMCLELGGLVLPYYAQRDIAKIYDLKNVLTCFAILVGFLVLYTLSPIRIPAYMAPLITPLFLIFPSFRKHAEDTRKFGKFLNFGINFHKNPD